eukprot:2589538-Pyramimonas_sp.AAC.1
MPPGTPHCTWAHTALPGYITWLPSGGAVMVMLVRAKTTTPLELDVVDSPVSKAADHSPCQPASRALF